MPHRLPPSLPLGGGMRTVIGSFMDLITTTSELAAACTRFARHNVITVDTEFLRETTYYPLLCVVQIASAEEAVVIDALGQGLDMKPFLALMADEKVLKVFHAARQDIEIIFHQAGIVPHPIFDTQVAAMVLGYGDSIAYDQLVERIAGHRPDKTHRFTDWSRRPLSAEQIHYAVSDVTHLRDVYAALDADLKKRGRSDWVAEEMELRLSPRAGLGATEDARAQAEGTGGAHGSRGLAGAGSAVPRRSAQPRPEG
jgi:ribonuclease D